MTLLVEEEMRRYSYQQQNGTLEARKVHASKHMKKRQWDAMNESNSANVSNEEKPVLLFECFVRVQFLELYGEEVQDLLWNISIFKFVMVDQMLNRKLFLHWEQKSVLQKNPTGATAMNAESLREQTKTTVH
eukprot:2494459-Ditylum_brightwellii.AAC.1